jgi:Fe-S oxidoreductase
MLSAEDIDFRYETPITGLEPLLGAAGFDAVYVATGRGGEDFGLWDSWNSELFTSDADKVFLGGMLCGMSVTEGIASGADASKVMESFLLTGRAAVFDAYDKTRREHVLRHDGATSIPRTEAAANIYTEEEAKAESTRCFKCDCGYCLSGCEMLEMFRKDPHKIAVEAYTDTKANPPFATCSLTRQTYSCNVCGYCKSVCPEGVDIGALLQRTRAVRKTAGTHIPVHDFRMREMEFYSGEAAYHSPLDGRSPLPYLFFPGCRLGASNPEYVLRASEFLAKEYSAGVFVSCCGAPAYWAGEDEALGSLLGRIRSVWNEAGRPVFVFACAYCSKVFDLFLPEIDKISLYELLSKAPVPHFGGFDAMAVFDPCAARDDASAQTGARDVAAKAGIRLHEMPEKNRCCGYGGHMRTVNPELYGRIVSNRVSESELPYIVYCANCRDVFTAAGKACVHILDIAFGLEPMKRGPDLQQQRDNAMLVKRTLSRIYDEASEFSPAPRAWDGVRLVKSERLSSAMDDKLILADDLREAIFMAESSGDKFIDESDGMCQCCLVKPSITYWVRYRKTAADTYEIFSAYYHRMRFEREA